MNETTEHKDIDFEAALKALEGLVEQMERGELTLEQSLQCFEQGVALTRESQQALTAAEQRVEILLEKNAQAEPVPFAQADNAADTD